MEFSPNEVYHVYNRGNNKQKVFFNEENYMFFLNKINTQIKPICDILCWCLMPNHFHLIIHTTKESCKSRDNFAGKEISELSFQIGKVLSSYSQAINKQNKTTGVLFQQRTKAKPIISLKDNNYLINAMHYCHQNPWKAGLVKKIEDWPYSSFPDYCGFRNGTLCNKNLLMDLSGYDLKNFYNDSYNIIEDFDENDFI